MESVSKAFRKLAKTCHDMCAPDQSCVQYWLLPERAPEWYRKIVLGTGSSDVHVRSAPRDALPLLGAGHASFCFRCGQATSSSVCPSWRTRSSSGWKAWAVGRPTRSPSES